MENSREYKTSHKKSNDNGFNDIPPGAYNSFVSDSEESLTDEAEKFMSQIKNIFLIMQK